MYISLRRVEGRGPAGFFGRFGGSRAKKWGSGGFLQLSLPIPTLFPIKMQKPVSVGCFGGLWRGFNTKLCLEGVREGGSGGLRSPEFLENREKMAGPRLPPNLGRRLYRVFFRVSGFFPLWPALVRRVEGCGPAGFFGRFEGPRFRRPKTGPKRAFKTGQKKGQNLGQNLGPKRGQNLGQKK